MSAVLFATYKVLLFRKSGGCFLGLPLKVLSSARRCVKLINPLELIVGFLIVFIQAISLSTVRFKFVYRVLHTHFSGHVSYELHMCC